MEYLHICMYACMYIHVFSSSSTTVNDFSKEVKNLMCIAAQGPDPYLDKIARFHKM
jgi:hypothetical protein